jgi:predicted nucleic acid-binding protein
VNVLLDTDVAIEILRARNRDVLSKWVALTQPGNVVFYSPVVSAEVWAGALPHEHNVISTFFRPLQFLPADEETGVIAGAFMRQFARSHALDIPAALIAASAIQYQVALWTRNRKHYPMKVLTFF